MAQPLIELQTVSRVFSSEGREITAVDEMALSISPGEIVCLVGESGCGKTTAGKIVAGLLRPSSGQVRYKGQDVWGMDKAAFKRYRHAVQIIHQDPYASLNPAHTVYKILSAPLLRHRLVPNRRQAKARIIELLEIVGLTPPEDLIDKYPHQLSGGQRQRVSVARALTVNPDFIVADEAVSMVDVSIRVSLLNMLSRLNQELGVTFLFITHDLAVAKYFAWEGRIAVMYVGRIVEMAPTPKLVNQPGHPYARALLSAVPEADPELTRHKERVRLRSAGVPSLFNLPSGCKFHPRCPLFEAGLCDEVEPALEPLGALSSNGRRLACHVVAREWSQPT